MLPLAAPAGGDGNDRPKRQRPGRRYRARLNLRRKLRARTSSATRIVDDAAPPAPQPRAGAVREEYRPAARQVCASLRHVLPLAQQGGGDAERPKRQRLSRRHRVIINVRRRARSAGATRVREPPPAAAARRSPGIEFRAAARQVCASLRHVLPLAQQGGRGGDERPRRLRAGRRHRVRVNLRRRGRAALPAPSTDLDALLAAIAADVQAKSSFASAGIQADFACRMAAAVRTAPHHQLAGILQALQAELAQALAGIAETAAAEASGRQQSAVMASAGTTPAAEPDGPADDDERPERPARGAHAAPRALAR